MTSQDLAHAKAHAQALHSILAKEYADTGMDLARIRAEQSFYIREWLDLITPDQAIKRRLSPPEAKTAFAKLRHEAGLNEQQTSALLEPGWDKD